MRMRLLATAFGCLAVLGCDWESADRPTQEPGPAERGTPVDPQPGNPLELPEEQAQPRSP